ncbi:MAG TPA: hypothetical protein VEQ11_16605 [Chloroflexota bacterium]|nr:hypothetical protein [Chloroflexota bacterium]
MPTREALRRLIDELPDLELLALVRFAEFLHTRALGGERLLRFLADAPLDDEPLTAGDKEALAASYDSRSEERIRQDELRRELGL